MEDGILEVTIVVRGEQLPELAQGYAHLYRMTRYENVLYYKPYAPETDDYEGDIRQAMAELEEAPQGLDPEALSINLCMGFLEEKDGEPAFCYQSVDLDLEEVPFVRRHLSLFHDMLTQQHR